MPRYLTLHSLACLTRQGAQQLADRLAVAPSLPTGAGISARRIQVNMLEGKMLVEFEVADRATLENWLAAERFHYDWLMRVELESHPGEQGSKLEPVP